MSQTLPLFSDSDPAVFVADLLDLRARAGAPSYAALSRRTGLPRSTIYDGLHRPGLPTLELTLALVHTLGGDPADWQGRWAALRSHLDAPAPAADVVTGRAESGAAAGLAAPTRLHAVSEPAPAAARPADPVWYRPRFWTFGAVVVVLVAFAAGALTSAAVRHRSAPGCAHATMYRITGEGNLLDSSRHVVAVLAAGDLFVVGERTTGPYAHRLFGTVESTGQQGYVDEAKIDRLRQSCSGGHPAE